VFFLKSIFKGLDYSTKRYRSRHSFDIESEIIEKELKEQTRKKSELFDKVAKYSRDNPSKMASLLNKWLIEEDERKE
ncbi:hypothetical protein DRQ09_10085, partial [candidate division KSB1 bacterium]